MNMKTSDFLQIVKADLSRAKTVEMAVSIVSQKIEDLKMAEMAAERSGAEPPAVEKMEWYDLDKLSYFGNIGAIWLDQNNAWSSKAEVWVSNTPPLFGHWDSREEAKQAIVNALRKQYTELLERLPD